MSPGFYEAVQKTTVELVTDAIERVEPHAVRTVDGRCHDLDVLVLATGFDPQAYFLPMQLIGEQGRRISELWKDGPIAYRSMMIPFMPNFFMIEGPFSPVGNVSAVLIAEWQAEYILQCLMAVAERRAALTPDLLRTQEMMTAYKAATRETIWYTGGCRSWYLDRDGVPILYPYTADQFEREMKMAPDLSEYRFGPLQGETSGG